ncbi:MAG: hypothetical protein Q7T11_05750 [Deltaproteobacteria bacterium]|nr:hypothetical protein [Deltaproteobacteria bacterium]
MAKRLRIFYDEDVQVFDVAYGHVLMMADALSDGIVKKFPNKF